MDQAAAAGAAAEAKQALPAAVAAVSNKDLGLVAAVEAVQFGNVKKTETGWNKLFIKRNLIVERDLGDAKFDVMYVNSGSHRTFLRVRTTDPEIMAFLMAINEKACEGAKLKCDKLIPGTTPENYFSTWNPDIDENAFRQFAEERTLEGGDSAVDSGISLPSDRLVVMPEVGDTVTNLRLKFWGVEASPGSKTEPPRCYAAVSVTALELLPAAGEPLCPDTEDEDNAEE
jgi:hypothetical protein